MFWSIAKLKKVILILVVYIILQIIYVHVHFHHLNPFSCSSVLCSGCQVTCVNNAYELFDFSATPNVSFDRSKLLLLIISAPNDFERRSMIRRTWATSRRLDAVSAARVFVVGESTKLHINEQLKHERETYNDILTDSVLVDSYNNLTRKVMSSLYWAASQPWSQLQYIAKIDSDCFVNVGQLSRLAVNISLSFTEPWVTGCAWYNVDPIRNQSSKWFVSKREFSHRKYPNYTNGPSYMFSVNAVQRLMNLETLNEVKEGRALRLEDIYTTGILRQRLNIALVQNNDLFLFRVPLTNKTYDLNLLKSAKYVAVHGVASLNDYKKLQSFEDLKHGIG